MNGQINDCEEMNERKDHGKASRRTGISYVGGGRRPLITLFCLYLRVARSLL